MPSVTDWLVSLRISPSDAADYTAALVDLGFDDVQALQEDANEDDLRQAKMKPGHVRRVLRELHRENRQQRSGGSFSTASATTSPATIPSPSPDASVRSSSRNSVNDACDENGGGVNAIAGSNIVLTAGKSCVVTCEDSFGHQQRFAIARSSDENALAVRRLDENQGEVSESQEKAAPLRTPMRDTLDKERRTPRSLLQAMPKFQSETRSYSWPACAPKRRGISPTPRRRASSADEADGIPATSMASRGMRAKFARSGQILKKSGPSTLLPSPIGTCAPRGACRRVPRRIGGNVRDAPGTDADFASNGSAFLVQESGSTTRNGHQSCVQFLPDTGAAEKKSPHHGAVDLEYIHEDADLVVSSGDSPGENMILRDVCAKAGRVTAANDSLAASRPFCEARGHLPAGRPGGRRRVSVELQARRPAAPHGKNKYSEGALLRMPSLTNTSAEGAATVFHPTPTGPAANRALETMSRSCAPAPRTKFHFIDDSAHSMSHIGAASSTATGKQPRSKSGRRGLTTRPPAALPCASEETDLGDAFGRGGHIKTLQRIRSTGGSEGNGAGQVRGYSTGGELFHNVPGVSRSLEAVDIPEKIDTLPPSREDHGAVMGAIEAGVEDAKGVSPQSSPRTNGLAGNETVGCRPPELSILQEQSFGDMEPSYDFSDGGTFVMHGFVLKPDGMKSTPTPRRAGITDSRTSSSRPWQEEKGRALPPPSLQTNFGSAGRTLCSRDSSFGGNARFQGVAGGRSWSTVVAPLVTTTPRRTRESTILLEQIGRGGGGTVHKALHVPSMRLVAVKMVEVHDDGKRRQMIQELRALLSMNRVPLKSSGEHNSGHGTCVSRPSTYGSPGSTTGSGSGGSSDGGDARSSRTDSGAASWGDGDSPAYDMGAEDDFSGTDGGDPTRTTATATPPSCTGTLSSHDGTPFSSKQQQHQVSRSTGQAGSGGVLCDQPSSRRPESTCGFAPGSRGSCGQDGAGVGVGTLFVRPAPEQTNWRKSYGSRNGCFGGSGSSSGDRGVRRNVPVVAFHDAYTDTERGRVCMVMEYMDGGTLQDFVSRGVSLSEPALAAVARLVLRGLAEMHANHQIHRDIKPDNILLDRHGRVKISDFGVVRELNRTGSLAQTFTGTLTYMSPERITERDYSCSSDVWSLGMVIAALALGHFPLSLSSRAGYFDMVQAITEDPVPALPPQTFSAELCNFVEQMLQRAPADRSTSAELLKHPFLQRHHDSHRLVGMIKVAPATSAEVQSLLSKVVEYHMASTTDERNASFFSKDTASAGGCSPRVARLPRLKKADVEVLAAQLHVTRTEIVDVYNEHRKRAERDLACASDRVSSRSRGFGGSGSGSGSGSVCGAPLLTPNVSRARAPRLRTVSSPQCLDFVDCPPRHTCETPSTSGSAFSSATSRHKRRQAGTSVKCARTPRPSTPRRRSAVDTRKMTPSSGKRRTLE